MGTGQRHTGNTGDATRGGAPWRAQAGGHLPPPAEGQRGHRSWQWDRLQHVGGFLRCRSARSNRGAGRTFFFQNWPTPWGMGQRNLAKRQDMDTSCTGERHHQRPGPEPVLPCDAEPVLTGSGKWQELEPARDPRGWRSGEDPRSASCRGAGEWPKRGAFGCECWTGRGQNHTPRQPKKRLPQNLPRKGPSGGSAGRASCSPGARKAAGVLVFVQIM